MKLTEIIKLKRKLRILKHANNDLESELALQKEYNASNLRTINELRLESERQLSEAKEIIKDILSLGVFGIFKGTTSEEIVDKAEQFIKEC